jgi:membrane-associated phospholipid phosphatase
MNSEKVIATARAQAARLGIAVVAALLVALIAHDVRTEGSLSALDTPVLAWFSSIRNVFLDHLLSWASLSGGPSATSVYAAILIAAYLLRRRAAPALTVGAIVYGAALTNVGLKHLMHRGRPVVEDPLTTLATFSFPSGHAAASTVFGGLVCLLMLRSEFPLSPTALVVALAISWVALVCISRAYLGLHYPTDIIAGVSEGVCWLMVATLVSDWLGIDLRWSGRTGQA